MSGPSVAQERMLKVVAAIVEKCQGEPWWRGVSVAPETDGFKVVVHVLPGVDLHFEDAPGIVVTVERVERRGAGAPGAAPLQPASSLARVPPLPSPPPPRSESRSVDLTGDATLERLERQLLRVARLGDDLGLPHCLRRGSALVFPYVFEGRDATLRVDARSGVVRLDTWIETPGGRENDPKREDLPPERALAEVDRLEARLRGVAVEAVMRRIAEERRLTDETQAAAEVERVIRGRR